jgi:hypothetical protein
MRVGSLAITQDQLLLVVLIIAIVALIALVLMKRPPAGPGPGWNLPRVLLLIALILFVLTGLGVVPGLAWGLAFWVASALV